MSGSRGSYFCLVLVLLNLIGDSHATFFVPHIGLTPNGLGIHQGHLPGVINAINGAGASAFNAGGHATFNGGSQAQGQGAGTSFANAGYQRSSNAAGALNVNGGSQSSGAETQGLNVVGGRHSVNAGGSASYHRSTSSSYNRESVYESRGGKSHVQGQAVNGGVKNGPPCPP